MYQLRIPVFIGLALFSQYIFAQDVQAHNAEAAPSSVTLQTPVIEEVRPVVDPLAAGAAPTPGAISESTAPVAQPANQSQEVASPVTPVPVELPPAPTPITPTKVEEKIIEPSGIDTVDVKEPEGNWLFKRIWWEKSKEVYGKIRERVDKIVESRMHFFRERVKLDREVLDPFYVDMGLDQGALKESVDHLLGLFKKDLDEDGALSPAAREKYAALQEEKAAITKLSESINSVRDLDKKLDDALEKLMNQINLARSYESDAWNYLNQIAEELNDKKAREYYYIIASLWRNVKEIGNYIQGPFAQHFIQLAQASVQSVKSIKSIADVLQQKGFALKERVELTLKDEEKPEEDEDEWPVKKAPQGWGAWAWDMITAPFSWLTGLFG